MDYTDMTLFHVDLTLSYILLDFKVRIHKDGRLEFRDPPIDLDYAILMDSMGDSDYRFEVALHRNWSEDPIGTISANFRPEIRFCLASDYCEHVLPIYQKEAPNDTRPITILSFLRNRSEKQATIEEMHQSRTLAHGMVMDETELRLSPGAHDVVNAFWAATRMYMSGEEIDYQGYDSRTLSDVSELACDAAGSAVKNAAANFEERTWQIRRFVDVANAWKNHEPIPDVKETP